MEAYLIHVAFRMWMRSSSPVGVRPRPATHAFQQGFPANLFDPKPVLFAAFVLVMDFPASPGIGDGFAIVANPHVVELVFYSILAAGISAPVVPTCDMRPRLWIDRATAAVLGAPGLQILPGPS